MRERVIIAVLIVSLVIMACFAAWTIYADFSNPKRPVEVSVGTFPTWDAAVTASLKRLSQEIKRHPKAYRYTIYFSQRVRDRHGIGGSVLFVPSTKQIGFENDPGSGFVAYWTNVDSVAISSAADTNGTFLSFGREAWYSEASYAP